MRALPRSRSASLVAVLSVAALLAACGGGDASPSASADPTATPGASAEGSPSAEPGGPAALEAPGEVEAGASFDVAWTGPNGSGDYVTIVAAGTEAWTNEPYFATSGGSPGSLVAPIEPGDYELWYVSGADETVEAQIAITVTPFEGALQAPDEVAAGTQFEVAWNGPDGPGDFVTIVPAGAEAWTSGDPYFDTSTGSPGTLWAPMEGGDYELRYVTGADDETMASIPITVLPLEITLEAPKSVDAGSTFSVSWTGPDGQGDYLTIVPAGSGEGTYLSYVYTRDGSTVSLVAPDEPGAYEIWYASDRLPGTFASVPIEVE